MGLSEILSKAAREKAEQHRRLTGQSQLGPPTVGRNKLWDALNAVCDFAPQGPPEIAACKWASLFVTACDQLMAAGEVGRLQAMRYMGPDALRLEGTETAFRVCELACAHKRADVITALRELIAGHSTNLENAFRLYLESVRDNRRWWAPAGDAKH
jgi:hypothetical protein